MRIMQVYWLAGLIKLSYVNISGWINYLHFSRQKHYPVIISQKQTRATHCPISLFSINWENLHSHKMHSGSKRNLVNKDHCVTMQIFTKRL